MTSVDGIYRYALLSDLPHFGNCLFYNCKVRYSDVEKISTDENEVDLPFDADVHRP